MNPNSLLDRVDRALAEWQATCPDLDLTASAVTLRLVLLGRYMEQQAKTGLAPFDIQPWEFDVLATLRRKGEPYELSAGELARSVLMTCSGMTHRLDRLQARGLVERAASPSDRRQVLVRLTLAGRELVDTAVQRRAESACQLMDLFSTEEAARLAGDLRRLLIALEQGGNCCGSSA
ncbi:MAG: MarR family transcriptional regulator [Gammaproteobacteria bacterium]|nr:MarR family transcriptional regulator [Gammaproteobacteria bacterium]MDX5503239.1 MarR family transcriptional regulator [Halomonas sp.]